MTEDVLTANEEAVLEALYHADKRGEDALNDIELAHLTGLSIKAVKAATKQLADDGYIQWDRHAVH